jgi:HSP20 family protein
MNLIRWRDRGPVSTLRGDLDDLFETMMNRFPSPELAKRLPEVFRGGPFPAVNVAETEKDVTVSVELPGLDEKDIEVELMGNTLTISGERKWSEEKKKKDYVRMESQYGSFQRSVVLPEGLRTDPDVVTATYKKGMLEVTVPKVEPTPVAKIKVSKT